MKPFNVLVADPPWKFGDKLPGKGRGAEKHYCCLSLEDIKNFELPPLENDCWLFLWRVGAMQSEALEVAKHWGFRVDSDIPWVKVPKVKTPEQIARKAIKQALEIADFNIFEENSKFIKSNTSFVAEIAAEIALKEARRVRIMMGRSVRNAHESCLVCKRGKPFRSDAGVPSVIFGEVGKHSEKPREFYKAIDRLVGNDARVVELFARRQWRNWTCLGNEMKEAAE